MKLRSVYLFLVIGIVVLLGAGVPPIFSPIVKVHSTPDEDWNGTGFFVAPDIALTAAHVLSEAGARKVNVGDDVAVTLLTENKKLSGWILYYDAETDIAAIKIPKYKHPAPLKVSFRVPILEEKLKVTGVFMGSPFVFSPTVSSITKLAWSDGSAPEKEQEMIIYYPSGLPGTSGSPVTDGEGYVIGIHVGSMRAFGIATPLWKVEKNLRNLGLGVPP